MRKVIHCVFFLLFVCLDPKCSTCFFSGNAFPTHGDAHANHVATMAPSKLQGAFFFEQFFGKKKPSSPVSFLTSQEKKRKKSALGGSGAAPPREKLMWPRSGIFFCLDLFFALKRKNDRNVLKYQQSKQSKRREKGSYVGRRSVCAANASRRKGS